MARMPGAVWRPLPGTSTSRISSYDITCFHTMVGSLAGTDNYFRTQASGTNSHFGVGGDGTIYQWVDTAYRSGANYLGNYHIVAIETADMGAPFGPWLGSDVPAWTEAQLEANAAIARWVHDTHGIPLAEIPDAKPGRKGVGYHRLGVPGYMVAGAEQWSTSVGKVCPGDRRIAQVPQIIALANGDDMPTADDIWNDVLPVKSGAGPAAARDWLQDARIAAGQAVSELTSETPGSLNADLRGDLANKQKQLDALAAKLDAILAKLG